MINMVSFAIRRFHVCELVVLVALFYQSSFGFVLPSTTDDTELSLLLDDTFLDSEDFSRFRRAAEGSGDDDESGELGNILNVESTGASDKTAAQDGLEESGKEASQKMAETDKKKVDQYKDTIEKVGKELGIDPAIIAGIISRESRGNENLLKNGWGADGSDYGLMQVSKHNKPNMKDGPGGYSHIKQASEILKKSIEGVTKKHPDWTKEQQLKGGISAYNAGVKNVQTLKGMDIGTTGNDYSNDVVERAKWFKNNGY